MSITDIEVDKAVTRLSERAAAAAPAQLPVVPNDVAIIQAIQQVATNPNADIDKMERLMAMHKEMLAQQAEVKYAEAMARVNANMPVIRRTADNQQTSSKYATEMDIDRVAKPIYAAEGFSIDYDTLDNPKDGHVGVVAFVRHAGGHVERKHVEFPLDSAGIAGKVNKTGPHAYKSSISYAKGTLICMAFNIATGEMDDDGNAAGTQVILPEHVEKIKVLLQKTGTVDKEGKPLKPFLTFAKADSVETIRLRDYDRVLKMLEQRAKRSGNS